MRPLPLLIRIASDPMTAVDDGTIPHRPISGQKRRLSAAGTSRHPAVRSKLPRRGRTILADGISSSDAPADSDDVNDHDSSSTSCFRSVISVDAALVESGRPKHPPSPEVTIDGAPAGEFRRVTRLHARRIKRELEAKRSKLECLKDGEKNETAVSGGIEASVSEVSEVVGGPSNVDPKEGSAATTSLEKEPEISIASCIASVAGAICGKISKSPARSQISQSSVARPGDHWDDLDSDLGCSERIFSAHGDDGEVDVESSNYITSCDEMTLSEFETELFYRSSSGSFYSSLDLTTSSGEEFSEKSATDAPSATFAFFLRLAQEFTPSSFRPSSGSQHDYSQEFRMRSFEQVEDEESYERLRCRERMEKMVHNYTSEYGHMVLDQRLLMINWMVEHSTAMKLHCETLFLGVSLLDRFLSRGSFKSEKNMQLLGIACITLATRIEENQPYNRIRQISFKVKANYYSKSEVVSMEWLVQEVLRFKCFAPTIHDFLWFYLKAAKADVYTQNLSRYLAVLSLLDHERLSFWPSSIAAGLVVLACLVSNHNDSCQMVMETHVRTKGDDLPECMQSLQWLIKYAC